MADVVTEIAKAQAELTVEERNLFSVAFKNCIGKRRGSWRILTSLKSKEVLYVKIRIIQEYIDKIEYEMIGICDKVYRILEEQLIPFTSNEELTVFYYKLMGDFLRYKCEFQPSKSREPASIKALEAYKTATGIN
jgi:14-3-3 protein epsilon